MVKSLQFWGLGGQGRSKAPRSGRTTSHDFPTTPNAYDASCGSDGTYNLLEAEISDRLARRKLENILRTGAEIVLAANAGCLLQIQRELRRGGLPLRVMHPMDLLDLSYRSQSLT